MTAREVTRRIERLGGRLLRQVGSHRRYAAVHTLADGTTIVAKTSVPMHAGDVPVGTLRAGVRKGVAAVSEHIYRVIVTRENRVWLADVPELDGAHTWARNLSALDRAVREVIVLAADLPDDAMPHLAVNYDIRTGQPELDEQARRLRELRAEQEQAAAELARETARMAQQLNREGWSVRDAAALLGISPQRVSQLAGRR